MGDERCDCMDGLVRGRAGFWYACGDCEMGDAWADAAYENPGPESDHEEPIGPEAMPAMFKTAAALEGYPEGNKNA